jgi:serine/threonine protein kinase
VDEPPVEAPPVGTRLDAYRLTGVLGKGGMSTVYLAEKEGEEKPVAVKVLEPRLARDDEFRQRFLRESRYASSLHHPNVIRVEAAGECDGLLYMAMDYVEGTDLHTLLAREGGLDVARALAIIAPIASALDAAHVTGLLHRDVNPANIIVVAGIEEGDPPDAYLTDFGLGKNRGQDTAALTAAGAFVGTFCYASPEQILGRQADHRADIYSLACVLFETLVGKPPFCDHREAMVLHAHVEDPPPKVTATRPELPTAIDDVLARALAKDPEDRFPTCTEMMAAARVALTVGIADPPPPPPSPSVTPMHPAMADTSIPGDQLLLRVTAGAAEGEEIEVREELIIGRHASGAGRLQGDGEISRRHARIARQGDGYECADLGSTNGTFLNGGKLEGACELHAGDVIEVGGTTLIVAGGVTPSGTPAAPSAVLSEQTLTLGRTTLKLDVDFDGRTARLEVGTGPEALQLVLEGGRWRPVQP